MAAPRAIGGHRRLHHGCDKASCIISITATACCTPKVSRSTDIAAAVGTPFYCYSTATLERHYKVFAARVRRRALARLLCHEGEFEPGRASRPWPISAPAPTWCPAGELKRALRGGHPAATIMFSGVGKTERGTCGGASTRAFSASMSSPSPSLSCSSGDRRRKGAATPTYRCASIPTSTPAPTPRSRPESPRTSSASRSAGPARFMLTRLRCRGVRVVRRRHAYWQPDHRTARHSPTPSRCSRSSCARCARTATLSIMSISAAVSAFPIATTTSRRRIRKPMPRWSSARRVDSIAR